MEKHGGKEQKKGEFSGGPTPSVNFLEDTTSSSASGVTGANPSSNDTVPETLAPTLDGGIKTELSQKSETTSGGATVGSATTQPSSTRGTTAGGKSERLEEDATPASHLDEEKSESESESDSDTEEEQTNARKDRGGKPSVNVITINAKKVQTGDYSVMNMTVPKGMNKIPAFSKQRKPKKTDKSPKPTTITNITADDVQTGDFAVMHLTVKDKKDKDMQAGGDRIGAGMHAGGEGTGAACEEFLKKNDRGVFTAKELSIMHDALRSVGRICFPLNGDIGHGSGFIVGGGHYFFTAWHVVRDITSVYQVGHPFSHDLSKLSGPGVYVDFAMDLSDTKHQFLLKPTVLYHDEQLDVALLQFQEMTPEGNKILFPSTLHKFTRFLDHIKDVAILGHGHPEKYLVVELKCEVIRSGSTKLVKAVNWFHSEGGSTIVRNLLTQSHALPDGLNSPYSQASDPKNIICDSFVTKGGSGSPMLTMAGEVVGLYTGGFPSFYWSIKEEIRGDLKKYVFGFGATFDKIYDSMKHSASQPHSHLTNEIIKDIFRIS